MIEANAERSTARTAAPKPSTDDQIGMEWWNSLSEKDRRRWMRLAGDTGRAVDAWRAFKGAQLSERELTPKDVLIDLFGEELHPDPEHLAKTVIQRLRDAGFEIKPIEYPKRGGR
jgi:hypothetical protein